MADKFIRLNSGQLVEKEATVVSAGAGDAGELVALDGSGKLDNSVMPVGIGADTAVIEASENLAAGDLVNIHASGSPLSDFVRKADASNGRRAHGFVLSSVTSGQNATVYFEGSITGLSGLTPGATMYLSGSVAGAATATPPSTSSYLVQEIGAASKTDEITFEPQRPVTLA